MMKRQIAVSCVALVLASGATTRVLADTLSDDVMMRALVDEMNRSMDLTFEGLPKPYLIQLHAQDRQINTMSAEYGALTSSDEAHNRMLNVRVRVGSYEL